MRRNYEGKHHKTIKRFIIILDMALESSTVKRKQQWVTVPGTKREAEKKLADLQHQMDNGSYTKPDKVTVGRFIDRWLQDYAWPNLSAGTVQPYYIMARKHLIPALGNIPLRQLAPAHLQEYYTKKLSSGRLDGNGGLSPRTVRHHRLLESAVKWQLVNRNVADSVDAPKFRQKEMRTFSEDDMISFLDSVK